MSRHERLNRLERHAAARPGIAERILINAGPMLRGAVRRRLLATSALARVPAVSNTLGSRDHGRAATASGGKRRPAVFGEPGFDERLVAPDADLDQDIGWDGWRGGKDERLRRAAFMALPTLAGQRAADASSVIDDVLKRLPAALDAAAPRASPELEEGAKATVARPLDLCRARAGTFDSGS